jgi:hypothetical protein
LTCLQNDTKCTKRCKQLETGGIVLLVFVRRFDVEREVDHRTSSLLERRHKAHKQTPYKGPWQPSHCTQSQSHWARYLRHSHFVTASMTSRFVDPHQLPKPIPQVKYELSHHQYCGQDRVLVTSVGIFTTLHDSQDSAQDLLQTTLNQYMSRGWIGSYCDDIDLQYSGLIAGYLSEQEHVYLSEIQIHAREKADQTVQSHTDGIAAWVLTTEHQPVSTRYGYSTAHRTYVALAPTETLTPWRPASTHNPPQQDFNYQSGHTRRMESFSRTRPQYPDRMDFFVLVLLPSMMRPWDFLLHSIMTPMHTNTSAQILRDNNLARSVMVSIKLFTIATGISRG